MMIRYPPGISWNKKSVYIGIKTTKLKHVHVLPHHDHPGDFEPTQGSIDSESEQHRTPFLQCHLGITI